MAYIVNVTQTATAVAATYTVTLGAHVSGDLLLVCLSQDGGGTSIAPDATATTAGWAMIGTGAASQGCRGQWAYLIADSSAEANPTFTGSNDDWIGTCIVIRDAHATAPFGATPTSGTDFVKADWGNSTNINHGDSGALTSAVDECLLIYSWCSDGAATANIMRSKLNDITALDKYSSTAIGHIIGCRQQQTAGAAPTVRMYSPVATEGGTGWVLAVRNKSGGALQPDIRPDATEISWYGSWATQHDGLTWQAPSSFTGSTINGIATSTQSPTVGNVTTNTNTPWGSGTSIEVTDAGPAWVGGTHAITSTDFSGKVISFQWDRNAASSTAAQGAEGVIVGFSDGTNWVTYQVAKPAKGWLNGVAEASFIAPGVSTEYANSDGDSSSSINWAAVTRVGYFWHKIAASTTAINVRHLTLFGTTALTGGGSSRPATFNDYQAAITSWQHYRAAEVQASSQILLKASVQIGDGTNGTYFDGAAQSFEFPQAWSSTSVANWQMSWNATANAVGLSVKAKSTDTINLASGVAATDTAQNLTVNAASSTSATYSFAQSFVGWRDPTDSAGLGWVGATFKECGTVTIAGGGDMTNCTIAKTTSTNAALAITANGSTLDGTTIDVTGTSAAYHLELGTAVTDVTLTDTTFTGTPGTDKVHVLKTSGTVTITISGTTSLVAGDVTSAGATVVIAAPSPTLDAVVLANTRAVLWNRTTSAELDNTFVAGTSWTKTITSGASSGDVLDLYAFKEGYAEAVATIIYSGVDATFAIEQAVDPAIDYYRTTESITDYTTLSEFNFYAPDIYIQSDDADGATSLKRMFIFYNGALTTEDGARYMRGGVTFRSAFDVVINRSVVPMAVDNVSATLGLYFTDEATIRVTTDDGSSWIALPSAPGSIRYAFGVSPGQIETGVSGLTGSESAQLMALPSAAETATAVAAAATASPFAVDVKKMNGATVAGTGIAGDLWRGA